MDMSTNTMIQDMMKKARKALAELESYNQEQIDALCKAMCQAFKAHAIELSKEVVEETQLGNYDDKVAKNLGTPDGIWSSMKGQKSVGIIREEPERGIMYVAKPKGVVIVVAPTTNPNITALCNAAISIKGRNVCIICSHPRAKKTTKHTVDILNDALKKLGAPDNLIQIVEEPNIEVTQEMMRTGDVIIATGGMGMVKSAYSSGKPAFGVGAGNNQTILDRGIDYREAVQQVIAGRALDNGLICACNQTAIIPREKFEEVLKIFGEEGAYVAEDAGEVAKIRNTVFVDGKANPKVVGQSALKIAQMAGINVPDNTKILVAKLDGVKIGADELLCGEKMCPVLAALPYDEFEDALRIAKTNLLYIGAGHSCTIHSKDQAHINRLSEMMPVCRVIINQPGTAAANPMGNNALVPTTTLGCGSWGNNSIDENLNFRHLLNVTRVARIDPSYTPVSEEELYG